MLTERNHTVQSPRPPMPKRKDSDPSTEVKTIEIDVMNTTNTPWLGLDAIETNLKASNELIKQSMKNYFVFIDYFK